MMPPKSQSGNTRSNHVIGMPTILDVAFATAEISMPGIWRETLFLDAELDQAGIGHIKHGIVIIQLRADRHYFLFDIIADGRQKSQGLLARLPYIIICKGAVFPKSPLSYRLSFPTPRLLQMRFPQFCQSQLPIH